MQDEECIRLMTEFIAARPELWNELQLAEVRLADNLVGMPRVRRHECRRGELKLALRGH